MVIIGIDPGSRHTGYGLIRIEGNQSFYITSGCIHLDTEKEIPERLQKIFFELQKIITLHQPVEAAIEQVFMHENPGSALKLGQARGAAIVALTIPVAEYSARQVKQSVVGYGAAKKEQVQHMVGRLLNITEKLQVDAADALAIALCHAHSRLSNKILLKNKSPQRSKKNRWRDYIPE
ncbi:MAG: crossover junction endodeoxyribonuclease RuvC [Gammaproteobacteria bacterium]|nr:crossover junction endodeoxyribonuclease RuvC [Gammaproteobacteria bacterium]